MNESSAPAEVFHLARSAEWQAAQTSGTYRGSEQDRSDGFLHFSTREQIVESAARHRAGERDLVLLTVPTETLGDALRWEASRGGALFPHLYGALAVSSVTGVDRLPVDEDGRHEFPDGFPGGLRA